MWLERRWVYGSIRKGREHFPVSRTGSAQPLPADRSGSLSDPRGEGPRLRGSSEGVPLDDVPASIRARQYSRDVVDNRYSSGRRFIARLIFMHDHRRYPSHAARPYLLQLFREDHPRIQPQGMQAPEEARVLHLYTVILHKFQAGCDGFPPDLFITNTQLQPEHPRAYLESFLQDRLQILRPAKDIDNLDPFAGLFRLNQRSVDALAEHNLPGIARIDQHNIIALSLQIDSYEMTGPVRIGREANDGNMLIRAQKTQAAVHVRHF